LKWTQNKETSSQACSCLACKVSRTGGLKYKQLKNEILGKKSQGKNKIKKDIKCAKCDTVIYQGCRHPCTLTQKNENMMAQTSDLMKERITHETLKKMIDEAKPDSESGLSQFKLRSKGRPGHYSIKKGLIKLRRRRLLFKTIQRGKVAAGMTNNMTNTFLRHVRHEVGRNWMESEVQEKLVEHN
jgi:hypothetical protein